MSITPARGNCCGLRPWKPWGPGGEGRHGVRSGSVLAFPDTPGLSRGQRGRLLECRGGPRTWGTGLLGGRRGAQGHRRSRGRPVAFQAVGRTSFLALLCVGCHACVGRGSTAGSPLVLVEEASGGLSELTRRRCPRRRNCSRICSWKRS